VVQPLYIQRNHFAELISQRNQCCYCYLPTDIAYSGIIHIPLQHWNWWMLTQLLLRTASCNCVSKCRKFYLVIKRVVFNHFFTSNWNHCGTYTSNAISVVTVAMLVTELLQECLLNRQQHILATELRMLMQLLRTVTVTTSDTSWNTSRRGSTTFTSNELLVELILQRNGVVIVNANELLQSRLNCFTITWQRYWTGGCWMQLLTVTVTAASNQKI
jgi:hypothetical protein